MSHLAINSAKWNIYQTIESTFSINELFDITWLNISYNLNCCNI